MTDPFTLTTVGATMLPLAVKFLFDQAGKILDNRRSQAAQNPQPGADTEEAEKIAQLEQSTEALRKYTVDGAEVHTTDQELADAVAAIQKDLESLSGKPVDVVAGLRERGVIVDLDHGDVHDPITGVKAKAIADDAYVNVKVHTGTVHRGGEVTGVHIDGTIG